MINLSLKDSGLFDRNDIFLQIVFFARKLTIIVILYAIVDTLFEIKIQMRRNRRDQ